MADMMKIVYFDSEPFWGFLPMLDYLVGKSICAKLSLLQLNSGSDRFLHAHLTTFSHILCYECYFIQMIFYIKTTFIFLFRVLVLSKVKWDELISWEDMSLK